MEKFHIKDTDQFFLYDKYSEDDVIGIGTLNGGGDLFLIDTQEMTAARLPEQYQKTRIFYYPEVGGYKDGLIMVSLLGEIDLQYHHVYHGSAGLWGWIDTDFNVIIPPEFPFAFHFSRGKALVCKGEWGMKPLMSQHEDLPEMSDEYYQRLDDKVHTYWCDDERWGVIDTQGNELVPCRFNELTPITGSNTLYLAHTGSWSVCNYCVFDEASQAEILRLDFDFDMGYMFNELFVTPENLLVFVEHQSGKGKDFIWVYDLAEHKYIAYHKVYKERTYMGRKKVIVQKDGRDIVVF